MLGIVRNRAIDNLRQTAARDRRRAEGDGVALTLAAPDDVQTDAVARGDGRRLRALSADLPEPQREVLALAYFGQLTHTEISVHLALPVGTVKGRMRPGLTKLRGRLAGWPRSPQVAPRRAEIIGSPDRVALVAPLARHDTSARRAEREEAPGPGWSTR